MVIIQSFTWTFWRKFSTVCLKARHFSVTFHVVRQFDLKHILNSILFSFRTSQWHSINPRAHLLTCWFCAAGKSLQTGQCLLWLLQFLLRGAWLRGSRAKRRQQQQQWSLRTSRSFYVWTCLMCVMLTNVAPRLWTVHTSAPLWGSELNRCGEQFTALKWGSCHHIRLTSLLFSQADFHFIGLLSPENCIKNYILQPRCIEVPADYSCYSIVTNRNVNNLDEHDSSCCLMKFEHRHTCW